MSAPRVSVVIPTKNAGPHFERTLAAIAAQKLDEPFELVMIDSGSTDGTVERARARGAAVLSIPAREFQHGATRNRAIAHCAGEYIALTVQDAIPADEHWLASLVAALNGAPDAAGAYSRHLPHEGAGFIARQVATYWHTQQGGRIVHRIDDAAAFERLGVEAKQRICTFNNVSSIIRRAVWERLPLRDIPYAEDLAWGLDVLCAGHTLIYEPASVVYHSHERSLSYEFRRAYVEARTVGELFGAPARPLAARQLADLARLWRETCAYLDGIAWAEPERSLSAAEIAPGDLREWYRRHLTRTVLARIFGGLSPYSEAERLDVLYALRQKDLTPNPSPRSGGGGVRTPHSTVWRGAGGAIVVMGLDQRINRAVWHNDAEALSSSDYDTIFALLWDELGRDYIRRAVEDEAMSETTNTLAGLELAIRQHTAGLAQAALAEGLLTAGLYRQIGRYAAAVEIGRRLGAANRYGAGGKWGKVVQWRLSRGV